jgi:uncharacterized protein (DUF2141 family)
MSALIVLLFTMFLSFGQPADLTVLATGFDSDKGELRIALYNSKPGFSRNDATGAFMAVATGITAKKAMFVFENIPPGTYAIKAFHDENGNQRLDTNFLGIPRERYAFSNNARGLFGPPAYEKAMFVLNSDHLVVELNLK